MIFDSLCSFLEKVDGRVFDWMIRHHMVTRCDIVVSIEMSVPVQGIG